MLQNADDAGATEIQFILDPRSLSTEKIITNSLKHLQGPSLCVYNNKSFTKRDLEGIQNLGEGTKSEDSTKTGQYGVGFNCVYHLTDIPTFLTNIENLGTVQCIFDPNCKYAPKATLSNPGCMYKIDELKDQFTDGFKGYLPEVFDISKSGTMFRLPLRTKEMQEQSEISKEVVDVTKVLQMFEEFKKDMCDSLLFLNSITKISLGQLEECASGIVVRNIYDVNVEMSIEAKSKRASFQKLVNERAAKLKCKSNLRISLSQAAFEEVDYEITTKDSNNQVFTWQIVQRFGFENSYQIPEDIITASCRGDIGLLPRGGVATLKRSISKERKSCNGRLFCFLPLPITVNFPVHINGHFALAHESRRNIFTDELCTDIRAKWNKCIMMSIISPAYCTLISLMYEHILKTATSAIEECQEIIEDFLSIFPENLLTQAIPYIDDMIKEMYAIIGRKNMIVLPLLPLHANIQLIRWQGPNGEQSHFDDLFHQLIDSDDSQTCLLEISRIFLPQSPRAHEKLQKLSIVREILTRCGFNIFACNISICKNFELSGVTVKRVSPKAVLVFLATYEKDETLCQLKSLPVKISESAYKDWPSLNVLLEYCSREPNYKDMLPGLPLLVTHDDMVRTFDVSFRRFLTNCTVIANQIPDKFIHNNVSSALQLDAETDLSLCQIFTVQAFSEILPNILPKDEFCKLDKGIPLETLGRHLKIENTESWLSMVWAFLASFAPERLIKSGDHLTDNLIISSQSYNEYLYPLYDWCLIPVSSTRDERLLPISKSSGILAYSPPNVMYTEVLKILDKIGVSRPKITHIYSVNNSNLLSNIVRVMDELLGSIDKPQTVLQSLEELLEQDESILCNSIDIAEGRRLLMYFSNVIKSGNKMFDGHETTFKKLPFYETIYQTKTSISKFNVYVLPSKIPKDGLECWTKSQSVTFLKHVFDISDLIKFLGCEVLSVTNLYCDHIFSKFSKLSTNCQLIHMNFVKDHIVYLKMHTTSPVNARYIEYKDELEKILKCLRTLAFIPDKNDELLTADRFYDPTNEVFCAMEDDDHFPPDIFRHDDWLPILTDCGLIHEITQNAFICYAKKVEAAFLNTAKNSDKEILEKSEKLLHHFLSRSDLNNSFLKQVVEIKFVKAHTVDPSLQQLHPQFKTINSNRIINLIAFNKSVLAKHDELVWTSQNLIKLSLEGDSITTESPMNWQNILCILGVADEPSIEMVLNHTVKLCNYIVGLVKPALPGQKLEQIMENIYKFLEEKHFSSEKYKEHPIFRTQCIFMKELALFVRPNQLSVDILYEQEIQPYLFKLPLHFGKFEALFLKLGATKKPSAIQYASVLETIYLKCNHGGLLHPDEKFAVQRAVFQLFPKLECMIKSLSEPQLFPELYLPCTDNRLHPSNEVVFIDGLNLMKRAGQNLNCAILIDFRPNISIESLKTVFNCLKKEKRPRFFSEICQEKLPLSCTDVHCQLGKLIKERLESSAFEFGFIRIIHHCLVRENFEVINNLAQKMLNNFKSILFIGHEKLVTELWFENKILPNSGKEIDFYFEIINSNGTDLNEVHINARFSGSNLFYRRLAKILIKHDTYNFNQILSSLLDILHCKLDEIQNVLDEHEIREWTNTSQLQEPFLAPLGTYVPMSVHYLLVQDVFRFCKGQLVAWEIDDPADRDEPGDPTYILVEIVERIRNDQSVYDIESDVTATYKIKIDMKGTEANVISSALYEFERDSSPASAGTDDTRNKHFESKSSKYEKPNAEPDLLTIQNEEKKDFPTTMREIIKLLKIAWAGTTEENRKIIKRLYLRYHPDKNPPNEKDFYTAVFQRMQNLKDMLSQGKSINDPIYEQEDLNSGAHNNLSSSKRRQSRGSYDNKFGNNFFNNMGARAKRHRKSREKFQQHQNSGHRTHSRWGDGGAGHGNSWGSGASNDSPQRERENFFRSFATEPNPQPMEAQRWRKQARYDTIAADNDGVNPSTCTAYEWMAFKYYMAAEKAIRAAQLATDANKVEDIQPGIRLEKLSQVLHDPELTNLALQLTNLCSSTHTQYPSRSNITQTPRDVITKEVADQAKILCEAIIKRAENIK